MKHLILIWIIVLAWFTANVTADTIYKWTDAQGVQRFSNEPPPDSVKTFDTIKSVNPPTQTQEPERQRRSSYDSMVESASSQADQLRKQRVSRENAAEINRQEVANQQRKAEIESKRRELEGEIAEIQKRAVSPTYPKGMKEAQIQKIQEQIDQLEK